MITPQQLPNTQVKPKWQLPVGVMESIVAYNCRKHGFPRPVLAMPMWEGAGNRALDYSGHGNHGDLNGPDWVADGLDFLTTTDYVHIPAHQSLDDMSNATFEVFIKMVDNTETYQALMAPFESNTNRFFIMYHGGKFGVYDDINNAGRIVLDTGTAAVNGQLYHIVVTISGTTWTFYIDGVEKVSTDLGVNMSDLGNGITIDLAAYYYGDVYYGKFSGIIIHSGIYRDALTAAQVKFLYDNPYFKYQIPEELYGYVAAAAGTDVYLTLAQYSGIAGSGQAVAQGPVTLSNVLTALDGGQGNTQAPVTLSNILSLTLGAEAVAQSTITISEILAILQTATTPGAGLIDSPNKRRSVAGIPAIPNNQIYGRDKQQIAGLYRGSFEYVPGALSLNEVIAVTSAGQAAASSDVTLSKVLTILQTYLAESNRSISLAEVLTAALSSEATTEGTLTLSDILTISLTEANIFNAAVTLACIQQLADSGIVTAGSDTTLNEILALAQSGLATAGSETTLLDVLSVLSSSEATAGAFITFAESLSIAQTTAEITQVYLTLAYNLAVQTSATSIAAATLTTAINAGISASVTIEVTEDLALSQILTASQAASAAATSQLSLNNILSITVLAEALASAGISLNMVEVITTDGTVAVSVVTPDGRTITIAVEVRTVIVAEEVRTAIVAEEDRTVIIT